MFYSSCGKLQSQYLCHALYFYYSGLIKDGSSITTLDISEGEEW